MTLSCTNIKYNAFGADLQFTTLSSSSSSNPLILIIQLFNLGCLLLLLLLILLLFLLLLIFKNLLILMSHLFHFGCFLAINSPVHAWWPSVYHPHVMEDPPDQAEFILLNKNVACFYNGFKYLYNRIHICQSRWGRDKLLLLHKQVCLVNSWSHHSHFLFSQRWGNWLQSQDSLR